MTELLHTVIAWGLCVKKLINLLYNRYPYSKSNFHVLLFVAKVSIVNILCKGASDNCLKTYS